MEWTGGVIKDRVSIKDGVRVQFFQQYCDHL